MQSAMRVHLSQLALVAASAVALALLASPANARSLRSTAATTISTAAVDEISSPPTDLVDPDRRRLEYEIDDLIVASKPK